MNQTEITLERAKIHTKITSLENQISMWRKELQKLNDFGRGLDDPHALIPKQFKTLPEWLEGHPFPDTVKSMIAKNLSEAEDWKISCNTYNFDYHVVKYTP